ncbi:hypothetical protein HNY73_006870 [Argiope bruennichi]|uniref:Uncharacterized protein n=1 Tax=Argiope bruennichi TaxID=94029 RepID=A0A8T0FCM9_ARGBR|nr:hypothetical protein HNY73_006870 [Argiope bruennichi]
MGPAEATKYHKEVLEMKSDFQPSNLANSRINPVRRTIEYWKKKSHISKPVKQACFLFQKLKQQITSYANINTEVAYEGNPFAVSVVTPIIKRSLSLPTSQEITFFDSISSCDPESHSVTFMLASCAAGAVPVGNFITKGQTEDSYKQGFTLVLDILKESVFHHHATFLQGPTTFITDDANAEVSALNKIWPEKFGITFVFFIERPEISIRESTPIARRAGGITRSSKRVASGHPSRGLHIPMKRKHNLKENAKLNQPNAKKH